MNIMKINYILIYYFPYIGLKIPDTGIEKSFVIFLENLADVQAFVNTHKVSLFL